VRTTVLHDTASKSRVIKTEYT